MSKRKRKEQKRVFVTEVSRPTISPVRVHVNDDRPALVELVPSCSLSICDAQVDLMGLVLGGKL